MAGLLGLRGHRVQQTAVSNKTGRSGCGMFGYMGSGSGLALDCMDDEMVGSCKGQVGHLKVTTTRGGCGVQQA
jgi:hypothetical protein